MNNEGSNNTDRSREAAIIAIVLLLSAAARLYDLGTKDIWYDESLSLLKGLLSLNMILRDSMSQIAPDAHPLLYPLFLFLWMKLGTSEFMVRLPSALAGTATVYFVYVMARALFGGRVALISALLTGLSPFLVSYSQEARNYIFHCLFTVTSLYCMWKFMEEENRRDAIRWAFLYGLLTWLNMNAHYFSMIFIVFENIFFFICKWGRSSKIRIWCGIQAALLIWLAFMTPLIMTQRSQILTFYGTWNPKVTAQNIVMLFLNLNFTVLQLHQNILYPMVNKLWGIALITLLLVIGLVRAFREGRRGLLIAGWLCFPIAVTLIASLRHSVLADRYFTAILPALFILIALALDSLKPKALGTISLCLLVLLYGSSLIQYYGKYTAPGYRGFFLQSLKGQKDFRGATGYIGAHAGKDDVILIDESFIFMPLLYYNHSLRKNIHPAKSADDIRRASEAPGIIFIHSVPPLPENMVPSWEAGSVPPELYSALEHYGVPVEKTSVKGIDIYVFRKRAQQTSVPYNILTSIINDTCPGNQEQQKLW